MRLTLKISALFLLFAGIGFAKEENPSRITESVAWDCEFAATHATIAFFGFNYRLKYFDTYSSMRFIEAYHPGKDTVGDFGLLTFGLSTTALVGFVIAAFRDSGTSDFGIERILITAPYMLNPEIRLSVFQNFRPYFGYTFNVVYDERFKPVGTIRAGIIFDHFKDQVRMKVGYEIVRIGREIENSIQVGLSFGINDFLKEN